MTAADTDSRIAVSARDSAVIRAATGTVMELFPKEEENLRNRSLLSRVMLIATCWTVLVGARAAPVFAGQPYGAVASISTLNLTACQLPLSPAACCLSSVPEAPTSAGNREWPGWRGLAMEGRHPGSDIPLDWSGDRNIAWKTPLPGRGYSSPIVSGDTAYVTTSYETTRGELFSQFVHALVFVMMSVVAILGIGFIIRSCGIRRTAVANLFRAVHAVAFGAILALLIGFVLFGEHVLHYSSSRDVRSWLSSGIGLSICLLLAAFYQPAKSRQRLLTGVLTIVLAAVFLALVPTPAREKIFSVEYWSNPAKELLVMIAIPAVLAMLGIFGMVVHLLGIRKTDDRSLAGTNESVGYLRLLVNIALVFGGIVAALALGTFAMIAAVRSSGYLTHFIAEKAQFEPDSGWWSVVLSAIILLASAGFFLNRARARSEGSKTVPSGVAFRVFLFLLSVLFLIANNYLGVRTELARAIVAVDRNDGKIRWVCEGLSAPLGPMNSLNSPATPTPASDGKRIYAYFGSVGMFCCDTEGNLVWKNEDLRYENVYGVAVSPVLSDGMIVLVMDTPKLPCIAAVDCNTGKRVWTTKRVAAEKYGFNGLSRSPLVKTWNGRKVAVVWGVEDLKLYDLRSGEELFSFPVVLASGDRVVSPVSDDSRIFLAGKEKAVCVDLDALPRQEEALVWTAEKISGPNCSSPVLCNGLLFTVSEMGYVTCLDASSGEKLWEHELLGEFFASPVAIGQCVYICDSDGHTTVFAAAQEKKKIAESDLSEPLFASLAPAGEQLFLRTEKHLYCIAGEADSQDLRTARAPHREASSLR